MTALIVLMVVVVAPMALMLALDHAVTREAARQLNDETFDRERC